MLKTSLKGDAAMKTLSIFLALINCLMAGLVLAFTISPTQLGQTETWWSLTKIAASLSVILVAVITWLGSMQTPKTALMSLCSLFLVALGAATIVWTFHLALVTGDTEFYMFLYGASLITQGMASLFGFAGDARSLTSL
jgi:hypothetical protein